MRQESQTEKARLDAQFRQIRRSQYLARLLWPRLLPRQLRPRERVMRKCDYCGAFFRGIPYFLFWFGKTYETCSANCKGRLSERLVMMLQPSSAASNHQR